MKEYYSLTEAAEILGYSNGSILRDYIHKGLVKGQKFGRNWVISHQELLKRQARIEANKEKREKIKV